MIKVLYQAMHMWGMENSCKIGTENSTAVEHKDRYIICAISTYAGTRINGRRLIQFRYHLIKTEFEM